MRDLLIKQQKCFFVVIAEEAVDDERLSPRDLGILVKLLRLPNNWDFSIKGLISIIKNIGECSIRKSLQNLEKYGYLTREILRDCSGKICGRNWIVRDYVPNCAKNENVESFQQNLSSRGGYSMQKAPENVESKINVFQHGSELTTKNEPKSAETRNLKPFSPGSIFYTRGGKGSVMPKHEAAISENPQSHTARNYALLRAIAEQLFCSSFTRNTERVFPLHETTASPLRAASTVMNSSSLTRMPVPQIV